VIASSWILPGHYFYISVVDVYIYLCLIMKSQSNVLQCHILDQEFLVWQMQGPTPMEANFLSALLR